MEIIFSGFFESFWLWCDHLGENALAFYQIISANSIKKCIVMGLENLYVNIQAYRVKRLSTIDMYLFEDV